MYRCKKCGLCCMQVGASLIYKELDRGDNICSNLDTETKLCKTYDKRPDLCNISKAYELYFKNQMSEEDYYDLNYKSCKKIRGMRGK